MEIATTENLARYLPKTAFAFRGYNVTNHGRSKELLEHPVYGSIVEPILRQGSEICSNTVGNPVDLVERIRNQEETSLDTFPADVAMIVAMEVAQLEILEQVFEIPVENAKSAFGYSIGEVSALHLAGVFNFDQLLPVPLQFAGECAELAKDVKMGIVFTRSESLSYDAVRKLCVEISAEDDGLIAPSAILSPNTVLVLGEGDTLKRARKRRREIFKEKVTFRENPHRWPPLHTPILWKRNVPNRSAIALHKIKGGFTAPKPPVFSMVTGKPSYNDYNARELLIRWADQPQNLWDVIYETISGGVEVVIHVGPEPNLIPSTFERLATNVSTQLGESFLRGIGKNVISHVSRSWVASMLSSKSSLLRAPYLKHIILEDWLLEQEVKE